MVEDGMKGIMDQIKTNNSISRDFEESKQTTFHLQNLTQQTPHMANAHSTPTMRGPEISNGISSTEPRIRRD